MEYAPVAELQLHLGAGRGRHAGVPGLQVDRFGRLAAVLIGSHGHAPSAAQCPIDGNRPPTHTVGGKRWSRSPTWRRASPTRPRARHLGCYRTRQCAGWRWQPQWSGWHWRPPGTAGCRKCRPGAWAVGIPVVWATRSSSDTS